jgi:FKBP-type peptidyl-prolyl cis-trans isomerase FklB
MREARFANSRHQCETNFMNKQTKTIVTIVAFAFLSAATLNAQTPSTTPAPATGSQSSGSGASGSAAKNAKPAGTGTSTGTAAHHTGTATAAAPLVLKTDKDKTSYAIGQSMAKSLERGGLTSADVNTTIIARAIRDALSGAKPAMTEDEQKAALTALGTASRTKMEAKNQVIGDENKKAGDTFLAANKAKDGVVTLPSGLQYKVISAGTGAKPTAADTVVCNYRGTLINGKEFDASANHGGPASFPVNGVIKGWTEALQLMTVGSKWQLYVPSDLAYGPRGAGGDIGPNATLIFDVELVSIKGK